VWRGPYGVGVATKESRACLTVFLVLIVGRFSLAANARIDDKADCDMKGTVDLNSAKSSPRSFFFGAMTYECTERVAWSTILLMFTTTIAATIAQSPVYKYDAKLDRHGALKRHTADATFNSHTNGVRALNPLFRYPVFFELKLNWLVGLDARRFGRKSSDRSIGNRTKQHVAKVALRQHSHRKHTCRLHSHVILMTAFYTRGALGGGRSPS